jgi:hypothetical protein
MYHHHHHLIPLIPSSVRPSSQLVFPFYFVLNLVFLFLHISSHLLFSKEIPLVLCCELQKAIDGAITPERRNPPFHIVSYDKHKITTQN